MKTTNLHDHRHTAILRREMTEMFIGIHVYRGMTSTVVTAPTAEACREKLMEEVAGHLDEGEEYQPNAMDDDLTVNCRNDADPHCFEQSAAYNFDEERWIGEGCPE